MAGALLVWLLLMHFDGVRGTTRSSRSKDIRCVQVQDDSPHSEGREGEGRGIWSDSANGSGDDDEKCWCFKPKRLIEWSGWGMTRVVTIQPFDAQLFNVWTASSEEAIVESMTKLEHHFLEQAAQMIGVRNACSPFGSRNRCTIRRSPFQEFCVGLRGRASYKTTIAMSLEWQIITLGLVTIAILVFIAAPAVSHSLYCYYMLAALFSAFFCIVLAFFFVFRRIMGSRNAFFVGVVAWSSAVWQNLLSNILYNEYSAFVIGLFGVAGFAMAYYYPLDNRGMFVFQVLIQFVCVTVVSFGSPSFQREGLIFLLALCLWEVSNFFGWPKLGWRRKTHNKRQGRVDMADESTGRVELNDSSLSFFTPSKKHRATERSIIEENYSGPLDISEENPFHCRGAPEYISEQEYRAQTLQSTEKAENALLEYYEREGLAKMAHLLSPQARRNIAECMARRAGGSMKVPQSDSDESL